LILAHLNEDDHDRDFAQTIHPQLNYSIKKPSGQGRALSYRYFPKPTVMYYRFIAYSKDILSSHNYILSFGECIGGEQGGARVTN
tara:strand:- start:343 stop:597 length:255 start_codon:yes stop_codon:yes gene_type:complete